MAGLWTSGRLLDIAQTERLFADGKTFVDMPLAGGSRAAEVEAAFQELTLHQEARTGHLAEETASFIRQHFEEAGSDLEEHTPRDWVPEPPGFLPGVPEGNVREWAVHVHGLWRKLCRKAKAAEPSNNGVGGCRSTLLLLPHPFQVPGSRFREMYYWDNLWVLKGLLVSKMHHSASCLLDNMLSLVERHGFVPNGSRAYYLNRSQPPLLSQMVRELYNATGDVEVLRRALPALEEEHRFFNQKHVTVSAAHREGKAYRLARYCANWEHPRPESYREDVETARAAAEAAGLPQGDASSASFMATVYRDLASAAESGWDFSSRWLKDGHNLHSIETTQVIPADLNAFLYQMDSNIAAFYRELVGGHQDGYEQKAEAYGALARERLEAINALMWDARGGQWRDLWPLQDGEGQEGHRRYVQSSRGPYASNFVPLWCGCAADAAQAAAAVVGLRDSGLVKEGGVATSLSVSGQQWDGDNGWPCLQSILIEGLRQYGGEAGGAMAADLAQRWLRNNFAGWRASGKMMEKYDVAAATAGTAGGGGEYAVQDGFGWTNGVALELLAKYPPAPGTD